LGLAAKLTRQVSVNDAHRYEEGFALKFEFAVDLDKPVNQDSAHFIIDFYLARHIIGFDP